MSDWNRKRLEQIANQLERFADGRQTADIEALRRDAAFLRSLAASPPTHEAERT